MPVARYMAVTIGMAMAIATAQVALALPAGYALAKLRFAGSRFAFGTVLACLLVPAQATFVPVFLMFAKVRLVDTMAALVLPFAASAFGTFLVRQALLERPRRDHRGGANGRRRRVDHRLPHPGADAPAHARVALSRELRLPLQRLLLAARHDDRRHGSHAAARASRCCANRGRACAGTSSWPATSSSRRPCWRCSRSHRNTSFAPCAADPPA